MPEIDTDTAQSGPNGDEAPQAPTLTINGGILLFGQLPVGQIAGGELTVDLGWCSLAGLSLTVRDDPAVDRHRNGVALHRPAARR